MSLPVHMPRRREARLPGSPAWLWIAPLGFLGLLFFYPLGAILWRSLIPSAAGTAPLSLARLVGPPLSFTCWQALLSTLLTLLLGLPGAYLFARFRFPGKQLLRALTTVPFVLPTVVVAAGFNALLGPRGWVNLALMSLLGTSTPPIHFLGSLGAILAAHVFYNTPIVLRLVGNQWAHLGRRTGEAARVLGASPWRAFREVTLPLLRPSLSAAALLVFLFDFTSFGVILLLGGPRYATLEVAVYTQALFMLNLRAAAVLCLTQLLCTLALTVVYSRLAARAASGLTPRAEAEVTTPPRTARQRLLVALLVAFLLVLLVSPLAGLALRSVVESETTPGAAGAVAPGLTLQYYRELFINRQQALFYVPPIEAARNSLLYAGVTVILSLALGLLAATALARPSALNRWLDPILMLPLGTSAVTLGLGFILALSQPPLNLRASPLLVPLAHTLVAFPFVVRSLQPALATIPERLRQAAAVLGASPLKVWREIDLPIIARAVLVAAAFAFTVSMGEFGATSLLARPQYPTLPIAIYRFLSQPGALNYGQAVAMATLLMLVSGTGILAIERARVPGTGVF